MIEAGCDVTPTHPPTILSPANAVNSTNGIPSHSSHSCPLWPYHLSLCMPATAPPPSTCPPIYRSFKNPPLPGNFNTIRSVIFTSSPSPNCLYSAPPPHPLLSTCAIPSHPIPSKREREREREREGKKRRKMMIHHSHSHHPTVHIPPPWPLMYPYPPSDEDVEVGEEEEEEDSGELSDPEYPDPSGDLYSSDEFRMYEFKIRRCARGRSHDWTDCPYAHPGEKARRRDPRKFHYSGSPCPDYKKGCCKKGESCEYAHGVFECWLHPSRYRTQPCKDGTGCRRRVCFFSHTPEQLRILSPRSTLMNKVDSYDGSPMRRLSKSSSTNSSNNSSRMMSSPPMSPGSCSEYGSLSSSMSPPVSPDGLALWLRRMRLAGGRVQGARGLGGFSGAAGSTPSPTTTRSRSMMVNVEEEAAEEGEEEEMMPDFGWVSELIK